MNDFTKEELQELLVLSYNDKISYTLYEKIQYMVSNYCVHNNCGGEIEIFVDTCSKCNAYILRNFYNE